jgi:thiamine kinase-like enzyme
LYACKGTVGIGRILKFALKKYKNKQLLDVTLSIKLSALALNNVNPHFNVVYRLYKQDLYSALATGDLRSFMKEYIRHDVMKNCLKQLLLAIFSFHRHTEMTHNDCHYGNFLYRRIPKGGHIWYKIGGKDVYIENLGYIWMINDFDMVTEEQNYRIDYEQAIEAFSQCKGKKIGKIVRELMLIIEKSEDDGSIFYDILSKSTLYNNKKIEHKVHNNFPYIL